MNLEKGRSYMIYWIQYMEIKIFAIKVKVIKLHMLGNTSFFLCQDIIVL